MSVYESASYTYIPCSGGHVFVYSCGISDGRVPPGTPCECGKTRAAYERCDHCGVERLVTVPVAKEA